MDCALFLGLQWKNKQKTARPFKCTLCTHSEQCMHAKNIFYYTILLLCITVYFILPRNNLRASHSRKTMAKKINYPQINIAAWVCKPAFQMIGKSKSIFNVIFVPQPLLHQHDKHYNLWLKKKRKKRNQKQPSQKPKQPTWEKPCLCNSISTQSRTCVSINSNKAVINKQMCCLQCFNLCYAVMLSSGIQCNYGTEESKPFS